MYWIEYVFTKTAGTYVYRSIGYFSRDYQIKTMKGVQKIVSLEKSRYDGRPIGERKVVESFKNFPGWRNRKVKPIFGSLKSGF